MKRSTIARKTPMKQTGMRKAAPAARAPMKKARPKMTPIRKSAAGEACTMRVPGVCNGDPATTVWAHSNRATDGKGMGKKARDEEGCYACCACHAFLDGGYAGKVPRAVAEQYFDLARAESQTILKRKGLL